MICVKGWLNKGDAKTVARRHETIWNESLMWYFHMERGWTRYAGKS